MLLARRIGRARAVPVALRALARSMFIQTEATPNPDSLKFLPGKEVLEAGSRDYRSFREAAASPLAKVGSRSLAYTVWAMAKVRAAFPSWAFAEAGLPLPAQCNSSAKQERRR